MISLDLARKLKLKLNRQNQVKVSGLGGIPTQITASAEVKITLGSRSVDLPVTSPENLYLMPGEHAVVRIQYGHTNPEREVVWAGRGDRWVTKIVYQARSWPVAIKVVNVSKHNVWIDMRTPLARIVQHGSFPQARRFVLSGTRAYREWQTLILEHAQSEQDRLRTERREQALRDREPPIVPNMEYQWPTRIMLRLQPGSMEVRMAQLQDPPRFKMLNRGELLAKANGWDPGEDDVLDDDRCDTVVDVPPEWTTEFEEAQGGETPAEVHPEQDISGSFPEPAPWTPLEKLEMEYERCMRVSAEDLDLEPGVYIHEGSEMLAQLRDQLVMLPELSELHPECDINQANVGVPGQTSPEDESRMRAILKRHRKIFLGDGNTAPAPARGV
ncbi:Aspartic protease, partial [Phytophthora megakarya]